MPEIPGVDLDALVTWMGAHNLGGGPLEDVTQLAADPRTCRGGSAAMTASTSCPRWPTSGDPAALRGVLAQGVADLGSVDIVLANAGILTGVWNTVSAAAPARIEAGRGGAIVLTSSTQGLSGRGGDGVAMTAYCAAKHGVVGLMRSFSHWLAPHNIRVNTVHPTGVNTPMIVNDMATEYFEEHPTMAAVFANLMDVDMVQPIDISHAIAWLVSDEARYVTGVTLPVDAGFCIR